MSRSRRRASHLPWPQHTRIDARAKKGRTTRGVVRPGGGGKEACREAACVKGNNPPCSSHTTADFALSRCVDRRLPSLLTFTSPRSMLLGDVVVRSGLGTMSKLFKPSFANSTPFEA